MESVYKNQNEIVLPKDMINVIAENLDFKTFIDYCKTNKLINDSCQHLYKSKLEQEIGSLTDYSTKQINKISKMVLHGSFRQDLVLLDYIFYINDKGLNKLFRGEPTVYKGSFVKILKSFINFKDKQLLLLDDDGKIWSYNFEDTWDNSDGALTQLTKNTTVVDMSCQINTKNILFAAITDEGEVFAAKTANKLNEDTEYVDIGEVKDGVKIAVGDTHAVVLDIHGDIYFYSYYFNHQVPLKFNHKDRVPFTKIPDISNVKQILTHDDDTICLKHDGSIVIFKPPSLRYDIVLDKHIVHIETNGKYNLYLLDNQGNLYKTNHHMITRFKTDMDESLIGKNVCDFTAGYNDDVVMINNNGLYSLGNNDWKGGYTSAPYIKPMFQYNPW